MKKSKLILLSKIAIGFLVIVLIFMLIWDPLEKNHNWPYIGLVFSFLPLTTVLFRKNEKKKIVFGLIIVLVCIIMYFVI